MNDKLKNLAVRTLSGAVLVAAVAGATVSEWTFGILVVIIAAGCIAEFYRLCGMRGFAPMRVIGIFATLAVVSMPLLLNAVQVKTEMRTVLCVLSFVLPLLIPLTFVCELWRRKGTPIVNIATTFLGVIYVAVPLLLLQFIPHMLGRNSWNQWAVMAYISVIWVNDVFAYLVGVSAGRHRLCERLSPKKSWEGFFGGVIAAVAAGVLFGRLLDGSLAMWGGLAFTLAVTGVAGDLVESMFKRAAGVKDSGTMFPGHGGFLDRFDSLLLSTPFAFIYLLLALITK